MSECFELPPLFSLAACREQLADHLYVEDLPRYRCQRVWLDSADHRLYHSDLALYLDRQGKKLSLHLFERQSGSELSTVIDSLPHWPEEIPQPRMRKRLAAVLKLRALIPLATQNLMIRPSRLLNRDLKAVAWLTWEEDDSAQSVGILTALRGYQKATSRLSKRLRQDIGLLPLAADRFTLMQQQQDLTAGHYSNKIRSRLQADCRADIALGSVLLELLEMMQFNEAGLLADTDTEFLHDYRIAIRKSRSLLAQTRGIFSAREQARARRVFSWLAECTSHKRDVDVYLLDLPRIANLLPAQEQPQLIALKGLLIKERQQERGKLKRSLNSKRYVEFKRHWRQWLQQLADKPAQGPRAGDAILQVASDNIWRLYRKLRRDGARITDDSPIDALHDLRKTGKKLRYLIEAYASLYPEQQLQQCLQDMKELQDALGSITDLDVQRHLLEQWQQRLASRHGEAVTGQALLLIAARLQRRELKKRRQFSQHFGRFHEQQVHRRFRQLFRSNKGKR